MKTRALASFIAFAAMLALAVGYFFVLGVRLGPPAHRTNLAMKIPDINGLFVDSNVLLRGVPVGKVTNLETTVEGATVDFYIDDRYQVPVNSDVKLENLSALGEAYLLLMPRTGSGPMLHDGQQIATDRISEPPYVSDLAVSVGRVLKQLDPEALKRIVDEADAATPPPDDVLPNLTHTSKLLRNVAADMHGRGAELLDNFQTLLRNASWVGPILAELIPYPPKLAWAAQAVAGSVITIAAHGGPEGVDAVHQLIDRIQNLADKNSGDLKIIGERFLPQFQKIAGALMNFDPSQILANLLTTLPDDGAVTLHVKFQP